MLPPIPLPLRPKPREWLITACVTSLVTLLLWLGVAYLRDPHYAPEFVAGLKELDKGQGKEARPLLDHALAAAHTNVDLYIKICEDAQQARQWPVLADYARSGLQNCPKAPLETRLYLMVKLVTGLTEAKPAGWQEETLRVAKQAYDLAPNEPEFQNLYAYNLADLRDDDASLKQAEAILTTTLESLGKMPDSDVVLNLRAMAQDSYGWTRCKQGDYSTAIDAFNRAISGVSALDYVDKTAQDEALKTIYYHLGVAQHRDGETEAARSALQRALSFDANYTEARAELAALP